MVLVLVIVNIYNTNFEATMLYALQCIGCSHLTPKPEQLASVRHVYEGHDVLYGYLLDIVLSSFTIRFRP